MVIRVHSYEQRDGLSVCRACGAVEAKSAVGPRWCSGRLPQIDARDSYERMREDYERLRAEEHERIAGDSRAAGAAEERARVVAMMRAEARLTPRLSTRAVLFLFADRIERGEA